MLTEQALKRAARETGGERMGQRRSDDLSAPRQHAAPEPAEEGAAQNRGNDGRKAENSHEGVSSYIQQLNDGKLPIPLDKGGNFPPAIELEVSELVRGECREEGDGGQQHHPQDR